MAFRLQDLPKTTRRDNTTKQRRIYPRFLRDDSIKPQLGIAIRYFETKLGLLRRDLDAEALIQLFGDPRLARCLVACLARSYRYRTRQFADLIGTERAAALKERGLAIPRDLRALAYGTANATAGFVPPHDRARFLNDLVPDLDLVEAEQALWLDAPDQAVLIRVGPVPTVEDIQALYNLRALETLLRAASVTHLSLRGDRSAVEAVCARYGVRVDIAGGTVTLHGQQDALGSWVRHGVRVARAALTLVGSGVLGPGDATVQLGDDACALNLGAPVLRTAVPMRGWSGPAATWESLEAFSAGLLAERRAGRLLGWRLRRWPEPLVTDSGAIWPEFTIGRGTIAIGLLPLTAAQVRANAAALQSLAERLPFVALVQGALPALPAGITTLRLDSPDAAASLANYLEATFPLSAADATPEWLLALIDAARAAGSLGAADLARRLDCPEEQVGPRLADLGESAADLVYIDGFGLCALDFLARARTLLADELARNGGRLDFGTAGRRLRILVGRNEGLHALMAHLLDTEHVEGWALAG